MQQLEKIHGVHKVWLQFKEISLFVLNATAESVDCSLFFFFEKYSKTFLQFDSQKNIIQHIENLPQHLLKKIIGDNISISLKKLRFIDYRYRLGFFEIIDYRFTTGLSCPSLIVVMGLQSACFNG